VVGSIQFKFIIRKRRLLIFDYFGTDLVLNPFCQTAFT